MSNDIRVTLSGNSTPLLPSEPIRATERMFPLQRPRSAKSAPHPLQIPWSVAEKAYCEYARQYGRGQSLERLAERGGFDGAEMDELYPPWRDEVSEITSLRARLAEAENSLRVSQMLYCGVSERCKEAEARAGRAEEAVKKLESDPRMGLRFTIGVSGRTMYATDDERTSDATASALSEAVGMVTWVKDHAARAAVEGAR